VQTIEAFANCRRTAGIREEMKKAILLHLAAQGL
jgi:hypothetical protein